MASKDETLGQTKQRHKLELRTLQCDIKMFQKKAKKDRLSKNEIEVQVKAMESMMKDRHELELQAFETRIEDAGTSTLHSDEAAKAAELSKQVKAQAKAQRKREAKQQQEQERRERIEEENKNTVSERQVEADLILAQLARHGLKIKDIPSDGHCMYHAVADQMKQKNLASTEEIARFEYLRKLTSEYMLAHPDDFLPFMELEESVDDAFTTYCDRVVTTADWGGQLELRALACALRTPIEIFSAESDVLVMGSEFGNEDQESTPKLQLTYHLHYYALGKHFNSVTPI
uniref:OTU domain-containing protein n=1 Tax=Peronospora matthiolae TaxID=2874970 RepID=A0AAV1UHA7_9STRA